MTSSTDDGPEPTERDPNGFAARTGRLVGGGDRGYLTEEVISEFGNLDRNIYRAVAATPTPTMDEAFRKVSLVANHGALWFAIAGATALLGGRRGRAAAIDGVTALAVTSVVTNAVMKPLLPRPRPDRELHQVIIARHVKLPRSTSFPSGHTSSAFAFANGVSGEMPELAIPLRLAAAAVAWSRVHTGVHYPGDVIAGGLLGGAIGQAIGSLRRRRERTAAGG